MISFTRESFLRRKSRGKARNLRGGEKIVATETSISPRVHPSIHVQYTRTESDRLGYATVRLTGSPIARDLEKYTEVFTEGVKC